MTNQRHKYGYTTYGNCRGWGRRMYARRASAELAIQRDQADCASHGGYSDRAVCEVDQKGVLYSDLENDVWIAGIGGAGCGAEKISFEAARFIK